MNEKQLRYNPNELVDIYDEYGILTGKILTKTEAKNKLLYHKVVHIWIINNKNQILIQKRSKSKKIFPGLWDISVAGHVTSGELSLETAIKEISEELGLDVKPEDLIYLYCLRRDFKAFGTSNMFFDTFLYKTSADISTMKINEREITELKFIDFSDLEKIANNCSDLCFAPRDLECKMIINILKSKFNFRTEKK